MMKEQVGMWDLQDYGWHRSSVVVLACCSHQHARCNMATVATICGLLKRVQMPEQ